MFRHIITNNAVQRHLSTIGSNSGNYKFTSSYVELNMASLRNGNN